jgi:hypothetical protein
VDEASARWSPVGSGTSLAWLVRHLASAEVSWVLHRFAGQEPAPADGDGPPGEPLEAAIAAYRQAWQRVDAVAFAGAGLDELCRHPPGDSPVSLRWVLMHLLEETARHAGHADILRELIDGSTGRLAEGVGLLVEVADLDARGSPKVVAGPRRGAVAGLVKQGDQRLDDGAEVRVILRGVLDRVLNPPPGPLARLQPLGDLGLQLHQRGIGAQLRGDGIVQPVQPAVDDLISLLIQPLPRALQLPDSPRDQVPGDQLQTHHEAPSRPCDPRNTN